MSLRTQWTGFFSEEISIFAENVERNHCLVINGKVGEVNEITFQTARHKRSFSRLQAYCKRTERQQENPGEERTKYFERADRNGNNLNATERGEEELKDICKQCKHATDKQHGGSCYCTLYGIIIGYSKTSCRGFKKGGGKGDE